jgi:hypothetical protein
MTTRATTPTGVVPRGKIAVATDQITRARR